MKRPFILSLETLEVEPGFSIMAPDSKYAWILVLCIGHARGVSEHGVIDYRYPLTVSQLAAVLHIGHRRAARVVQELSKADLITVGVGGQIALKRGLAGPRAYRDPVSSQLRQNVFQRDGHRCVQCSATESLQIDHIVPVSAGGRADAGNLRVLCRPCNVARNRREPVSQYAAR